MKEKSIKTYRIGVHREEYGYAIIKATSKREAKEKFDSWDIEELELDSELQNQEPEWEKDGDIEEVDEK